VIVGAEEELSGMREAFGANLEALPPVHAARRELKDPFRAGDREVENRIGYGFPRNVGMG
jgi:hypothetical protein